MVFGGGCSSDGAARSGAHCIPVQPMAPVFVRFQGLAGLWLEEWAVFHRFLGSRCTEDYLWLRGRPKDAHLSPLIPPGLEPWCLGGT